jgi:ribosomal protein S18 acetylase RimI-like enzyme
VVSACRGPEPRALEVSEVERAAALIARAFAWHEPWGAWTMPDANGREQRLRSLVEADVRDRFLPHGEAWTVGLQSVTLWIPARDRAGAETFARRRTEEDYAAYGDRQDAVRAADDLIRSLRPTEPHWFLDTIATEPDLFGRGLASRLLAHDLAVRDAAGDLSALDTHTPRQVAFYERHGFRVAGRGEPAPGFPIVVMIREPGASGPE